MANYWRKRAYQESATGPGGLAKRGLVYLMSEYFTVGGNASVSFALLTNGNSVEFQFYEFISNPDPVRATLWEAPTYTAFGPELTPRNLNRNFADDSTCTLRSASAVSGGTDIANEYLVGGNKQGGDVSSTKIHTLKPDTAYVMTFVNQEGGNTNCHINLGWAENDPATYRLIDPVDPAS